MAPASRVKVPDGFTDIATLCTSGRSGSRRVDVIGVAGDLFIPKQSKRDLMYTFSLTDLEANARPECRQGIQVRFFVQSESDLPQIEKLGDIVMLKSMELTMYGGRPLLKNHKATTEWLVFPRTTLPHKAFALGYESGKEILHSKRSRNVSAEIKMPQKYILALGQAFEELHQSFRAHAFPSNDATHQQHEPNIPTGPRAQSQTHNYTLARPGAQPVRYDGVPTGPRALDSRYANPLAARTNVDSFTPLYDNTDSRKRPAPNDDSNFDRRKISKSSKKLKLIKDMVGGGSSGEYVDFYAEVVQNFDNLYGVTLYVTDYTENTFLQYYNTPEEDKRNGGAAGDPYNYLNSTSKIPNGPFGRRVIVVTMKDNQEVHARNLNLQTGDQVFLQNVKIRLGASNLLEGTIWDDRKYYEKVLIHRAETRSPEIQDMNQRKAEYWISRQQYAMQEPAAEAEKSKSRKRKDKKVARNAEKRAQAEAQRDQEQDEIREAHQLASRPNAHVVCAHGDVSLCSVSAINDAEGARHTRQLDGDLSYRLPFVNANYRAKVRVVDYRPDKLEDFAIVAEESDSSLGLSQDSSQQWQWSFQLVVEDTTVAAPAGDMDTLTLDVGHKSAQFLLGQDMPDPTNLRTDRAMLNKLKEKLFILWGDLEEQKVANAEEVKSTAKPFEGCVSEYGLLKPDGEACNVDDWTRRYMLFGVSIK